MRFPLLCFRGLLLLLLAVPALHAQREKLPAEDLEIVETKWPAARKTSMGIRYMIQQEGTGAMPVPGDLVAVVYTGQLLDGHVFDKSVDPKKPFIFRLGREQVIQGWDFILPQMKVGERRMVIIPPELGYGTRGQPPRVPRSATLVFMIELLEIKRD